MLKEGQIRIPSGCAISGIFSKSGKRISGEAIINPLQQCVIAQTAWAEDLQVMESILNTKISMLSIYFMTVMWLKKSVKSFWNVISIS